MELKLIGNFKKAKLGESIEVSLTTGRSRTPVANFLNFDDFPCLDDTHCEDKDLEARVFAALFIASPELLKVVKLAYQHANVAHMLTPVSNAKHHEEIFKACQEAFAVIEQFVTRQDVEQVLRKFGWMQSGGDSEGTD